MRLARVAAVLTLAGGCAAPPPVPVLVTRCTPPRPQVCTMEYMPVCAEMVAGGSKEYSSACNACADDTVSSYLTGSCPE